MSDLLSIVLLILAGAVFAMSEISIAAARKIKLRVMADEGSAKALEVLELQQQPGNCVSHKYYINVCIIFVMLLIKKSKKLNTIIAIY